MVVEVVSEIDEIIRGEGETAVGQRKLHKCRAKLVCLAETLRESKPGTVISGAEVLLIVSQAIRLMYKWVRKD